MNNKRRLAIILISPLLAAMILCIILVALIFYAIDGKWQAREFIQETFGDNVAKFFNKNKGVLS